MHPWWEGATAWVSTRPGSARAAHLARTPWVSLTYWDPGTRWRWPSARRASRARPRSGPGSGRPPAADAAPYGDDLGAIFPAGPGDPGFGLLRLVAWRIELAGAAGDAPPPVTVWRRPRP